MIKILPFVLVAFTLAVAGSLPRRPSSTPRTASELCRNVSLEIDLQVYEGMISPEKAREITDRCFDLYVK